MEELVSGCVDGCYGDGYLVVEDALIKLIEFIGIDHHGGMTIGLFSDGVGLALVICFEEP